MEILDHHQRPIPLQLNQLEVSSSVWVGIQESENYLDGGVVQCEGGYCAKLYMHSIFGYAILVSVAMAHKVPCDACCPNGDWVGYCL